jgi:multiple sugar transport system permease protein
LKTATFLRFVGPSVFLMLALMALPLLVTFYLSVRNCAPQMQTVTVQQSGPFGVSESVTQQVKLDPSGKPIVQCRYVGFDYFRSVLGWSDQTPIADGPDAGKRPNEFIGALRFTLLYTLVTTPFVLLLGFLVALGVNSAAQRLRGFFITASLLPFIITPVVAALSIKWLFRDNGLVPYVLSHLGISVFWMAQEWSARLLIVLYGVWHATPFAFIVLYAGLQSVPQDALEAATIDGAGRWQRLRFVILPHLMPLVIFITLIHLMDSYRVFEPVIVLTQGAFTTSVQFLTYYTLVQENNPYKASAAAVLTTAGIFVLLIPLLVKTWNEQRRGL